MNNAINPYRQRGMILKPDEFCGRVRELREAFALIKTMQSVSVVGQRRIGKSSFLHRLTTPCNGELDAGFTVHYLDLQRVFSAEEFYVRACRKLDREDGESHLDLEEAIQNRKVIFCLDEFESAYKHDFGGEFFDALRSLAQTGNLALVVATQTPLNELHAQFLRDTDVTSKFHNIFTRLNLREFTPEEARQMVAKPHGNHQFSDAEINAILEVGKTHPYHLNLACAVFFDAKQDGSLTGESIPAQTLERLRRRFLDELALTNSRASTSGVTQAAFSSNTAKLTSSSLPDDASQSDSVLTLAKSNKMLRWAAVLSLLTLIFGLSGQGVATPVGIALLTILSFFSLVFLVASWITWPGQETRREL
ncbi:MAG TPA: hypothetical protein PLD20_14585 [Blastocatellia bacterium]|nr:hypothetical protein [Blastocatellia bacterium]HMV87052.1 hypothetical protein [Blastocatellia bacterium]HMY75622.1 hypothetical protein [Blastocatellia bacterium]HMZ19159.1 hypothetical protein [Blastocatellia bacterium]HNG30443.1 hypothetical protein [Blastocatellia bacterium]